MSMTPNDSSRSPYGERDHIPLNETETFEAIGNVNWRTVILRAGPSWSLEVQRNDGKKTSGTEEGDRPLIDA